MDRRGCDRMSCLVVSYTLGKRPLDAVLYECPVMLFSLAARRRVSDRAGAANQHQHSRRVICRRFAPRLVPSLGPLTGEGGKRLLGQQPDIGGESPRSLQGSARYVELRPDRARALLKAVTNTQPRTLTSALLELRQCPASSTARQQLSARTRTGQGAERARQRCPACPYLWTRGRFRRPASDCVSP